MRLYIDSFYKTFWGVRNITRIKALTDILILFFVDLASVIFAFELSVLIRTNVLPLIYPYFPQELPFTKFGMLWIFLIWLFFFYYEDLYTKTFSYWDEIKNLWRVSFFSTTAILAIVSIGKLSNEVSRTIILLMGFLSLLLFPFLRMSAKKFLRKRGLLGRKVLILGAGKTGALILRALKKEPNYGYEVVGFLDDDPEKIGSTIDGVKVHRGVDKASTYLQRCVVTDVFIAMPGAGKEKLQELINSLQHKVERVLFVPDMFGVAVLGTTLKHFFHEEAFAFELNNNLAQSFNIVIKKSFDVLLCLLLLPILFFPMLVIVLMIRIDSKGPAIFSQERIGKNGRLFRCFKFRTMHLDSEEQLEDLLKKDPESREEWHQYWKLKNDPRVTIMGRFLRATSLDELPQIVNVLRGEMTIVGPRPYLPKEKEYIGAHAETILLAKPGITGLWQVSGRSNTSYEYRVNLDAWYVRNWNIWLDIVLLLKTLRVVIKREGAF